MKKFTTTIFIIQLLFVLQSSNTVAQIKLAPYISYGTPTINYEFDGIKSKGEMGIGFGADILYHLSEYIIIGSGVRVNTYGANMSFNSFSLEQNLIDGDGDSYVLNADGSNIKEEHRATAIEIPILFRYQRWITSDIILYGATGPIFSILGKASSTVKNGTINTEGYYPEWNLTINETPEYGFYTRDIENKMPDTELKTSMGWLIEVGAEYYISKKANVSFGMYFQPAITNISKIDTQVSLLPGPDNYIGTLNSSDDVKISNIGIKVGVNFDLTPNKRSSIKSIR